MMLRRFIACLFAAILAFAPLAPPAAYAAPPPIPPSAPYNPPARVDMNARGGATLTRPYVIVAMGQSNMAGEAPCAGDANGNSAYSGCTVAANIKIWNTVWDGTTNHVGTAMVPAVFGNPPLAGMSLTAGAGLNNAAVQYANFLRLSHQISDSRPIWIIPNWFPGEPIANWIGSGTSSPYWTYLTQSLSGAGVTAIDEVMWMQGEADFNGSGSANSSFSTYKAGITTLITQLRGLSQWTPTTTITFQELRTWLNGSDRNDVFWNLKTGLDDRLIDVVSSANLTMLLSPSGQPTLNQNHWDAPSLTTIGQRHFNAVMHMSLGAGKPNSGLPDSNGAVQAPPKALSYGNTSSRSTVALNVDDLRNGAVITSTNTDFTLPDPADLPGAVRIVFHAWTQVGGNVTVTSPNALFFYASPVGTVAPRLSTLTLNDNVETVELIPANSNWQIVSDTSSFHGGFANGGVTTPTSGVYTYTVAQVMANACYHTAAGKHLLPDPSTVGRGQICLIPDQGGAIFMDTAVGSLIDQEDHAFAAGSFVPLNSGHPLILMPLSSTQWFVVGGAPSYRAKSTHYTPTSSATISLPIQGLTYVDPAGTIAALTIATPNPPNDGVTQTVVFSQAVTALTITPTAVGGVTPTIVGAPTGATAGQWLSLVYDQVINTWFVK